MELEGSVEDCLNVPPIKSPQLSREPMKQFSSAAESSSPASCFDCNICLDFATDPVVTLCGHLYCWPCIYKWLQVESESPQQCPVCKAPLSENALVPLYGRGHSTVAKGSQWSLRIPKRPSAHNNSLLSPGTEHIYMNSRPTIPRQRHQQQLMHHRHHYNPFYNDYPYTGYVASDHLLPSRFLNSTAGGGLGGIAALLLRLAFTNHQGPGMYSSSPYQLTTGMNVSRLRQEMQLGRSLHQMWIFLLCCALLCFFLF